jgi:hypothetical protein
LENVFRTPAESGAIIELEDEIQRAIEPNTELSFDQLKQMIEEEEAVLRWRLFVRNLFGPCPASAQMWGGNKFQMKIPTTIVAVRG